MRLGPVLFLAAATRAPNKFDIEPASRRAAAPPSPPPPKPPSQASILYFNYPAFALLCNIASERLQSSRFVRGEGRVR